MTLLHRVYGVLCWFLDFLLTYGGGQLDLAVASKLAVNFSLLFLSPEKNPAVAMNHKAGAEP